MRYLQVFNRSHQRRGTIAVLMAVLLIVIVGMMAIALDGGLLLDEHKQVQSAADAAALAAATQLFVNYPALQASNLPTYNWPSPTASNPPSYDPGGTAAAAALANASSNGFPNDGVASSVTVKIPPKSGPFTGQFAYVEVTITFNQKRFFSSIWGSTTTPVTARAVARGRWAGSGDGIIVLDPSAKNSFVSTGSGGMDVTGGAHVIVDSNYQPAASVTGGGGAAASEFDITGGDAGSFTGTVLTGTPPTPDPLRYLPVPSQPPAGTMTTTNLGNGNHRYLLTPGTYSSLPNFTTGDVVILQQASANDNGGIFYINGGGFTSTGASIIMDSNTSGGVMIYNNPTNSSNSQGINISGNSAGTVNLSALTSGTYAGLLFWQNRTATATMQLQGNGSFSLTGTFYAADALLKVSGGGTATIGSQYISRTLSLSGNGTVTINYTDKGTARLREVTLVE